jgi:hypothetical protein
MHLDRQRTELRNKLSLPTWISGRTFLKTIEFTSYFVEPALHYYLPTHYP